MKSKINPSSLFVVVNDLEKDDFESIMKSLSFHELATTEMYSSFQANPFKFFTVMTDREIISFFDSALTEISKRGVETDASDTISPKVLREIGELESHDIRSFINSYIAVNHANNEEYVLEKIKHFATSPLSFIMLLGEVASNDFFSFVRTKMKNRKEKMITLGESLSVIHHDIKTSHHKPKINPRSDLTSGTVLISARSKKSGIPDDILDIHDRMEKDRKSVPIKEQQRVQDYALKNLHAKWPDIHNLEKPTRAVGFNKAFNEVGEISKEPIDNAIQYTFDITRDEFRKMEHGSNIFPNSYYLLDSRLQNKLGLAFNKYDRVRVTIPKVNDRPQGFIIHVPIGSDLFVFDWSNNINYKNTEIIKFFMREMDSKNFSDDQTDEKDIMTIYVGGKDEA